MNAAPQTVSYDLAIERVARVPVSKRVLQDPHPALRAVCVPITEFGPHVYELCDAMQSAMNAGEVKGAGLSANQIGATVRVILVDFGGRTYMVNPEIVHSSKVEQRVDEGCLSVCRGVTRRTTTRAAEIVVRYLDRDGNARCGRAKGFRAAVIQHAVDLLDGKIFLDRIGAVRS
jgi:peptide deformylase